MAFDFNKVLASAKETAKNVGAKTAKIAKNVGDKTSATAKTVSLKSKIKAEEAAIAEIKKQLGDILFAQFENGEALGVDFTDLCTSIKEHMTTIEGIEAQIEELKAVSENDDAVETDADDVDDVVSATFEDEEKTEE